MIVYHPLAWTHAWPKDAKPFASRELAQQHTGLPSEDIIETPFNGEIEDVVTVAPNLVHPEVETQPAVVESSDAPVEQVEGEADQPSPEAPAAPVEPAVVSPAPVIAPAPQKPAKSRR